MPSSPVDVIINARSGTADKTEARRVIEGVFEAGGVQARVALAGSGEEIVDLARRAAKGEARTIVGGGGDGTISAVASMLVGTNKLLGVLPLGTLNHFAKDMQIPLDVEGAARTIAAGHAVTIDVGEVNERIFINNSSLGLYPSIVRRRQIGERLGRGKWPAFLWAAAAAFRRHPFLNVRLTSDEDKFRTRTLFVFVGNNEYEMEGFNIGKRLRLDGGQLSLYVTHHTSRLGLLLLPLRALFKRLRQARDFVVISTGALTVETRLRRVRVATDGEITWMKSPLQYRVRPASLRVIVPESIPDRD